MELLEGKATKLASELEVAPVELPEVELTREVREGLCMEAEPATEAEECDGPEAAEIIDAAPELCPLEFLLLEFLKLFIFEEL